MSVDNVHSTPELIVEALNAYQRSDALVAAIELDLFSGVAAGLGTPADLAAHCQASERGVRMLCDYLVVQGFLLKDSGRYSLREDAARFLDRASQGYLGTATHFLGAPTLRGGFRRLAEAVRKGGTAVDEQGSVAPDHEIWVHFARGMAPLMASTAASLAELLGRRCASARRVLDLAAGHGLFGIEIARRNPSTQVVAVDWPAVLEVARENARREGVADRYRDLPGSILDVAPGTGYDMVLLTNILHHFDRDSCTTVLRRAHAALEPGGCAVLLEYVPDESRVSPPRAAAFALVMLATTPAGDAYTFSEYREMLAAAGFDDARVEISDLPQSLHQVVLAER